MQLGKAGEVQLGAGQRGREQSQQLLLFEGVQDVARYKKAGGTEAIPRTLLLVDEFQEFFVEDDKISQTASLLLDRIVRQGRAFTRGDENEEEQ